MSYKTTALLLTRLRETIERMQAGGEGKLDGALAHLWSAWDALDEIARAQLVGGAPSLAAREGGVRWAR